MSNPHSWDSVEQATAQQWKYRVIFQDHPTAYPNDLIPQIDRHEPLMSLHETLEELGDECWELCAALPCVDQPGVSVLIFKRPWDITDEELAKHVPALAAAMEGDD